MWNAYKEGKRKYKVRYLSTAKRLSKEEIASMSKKEIKAEMDAADRKRAMCKESSPDNKMLLSNSVDLVLENCDRRIYGVCGFFIDIKGRDYERYGIRFQDVPEFDDCVSLESLFDECVQIIADSGLSIDYTKIESRRKSIGQYCLMLFDFLLFLLPTARRPASAEASSTE